MIRIPEEYVHVASISSAEKCWVRAANAGADVGEGIASGHISESCASEGLSF
jgi:hypothetical protein